MPPFSRSTALLAVASAVTASAVSLPVAAQEKRFSDVEFNYWARPFIEELAGRDIIAGFPDGTFKPTQPVTRAQFAAILRQAFDQSRTREYRAFTDLNSNYWAVPAIREAFETGFMSGYTDGSFKPEQKIPRVQALVSLASGLSLRPEERSVNASLIRYQDAAQIPEYAKVGVAAATQNSIVVNYPNPKYLNPNEVTTRADVAAFVYQALVDQGQLEPLAKSLKANDYVVVTNTVTEVPKVTTATTSDPVGAESPATSGNVSGEPVAVGTRIPVKSPGARPLKYAIAPNEVYATNLVVSQNIMDSDGRVLVPQGSVVRGAFEPVKIQQGTEEKVATRYVAQSIRIGNRVYRIDAASSPRLATAATDLEAESVGSNVETSDAAQSILRTILPQVGETLFGKETQPQSKPVEEDTVILIDPAKDIDLTVRSIFQVEI